MTNQMNPVLAAAYQTVRVPTQEQIDSAAVYNALDKLASADGYDISQMSDAQVQQALTYYTQKIAAEAAADAPPPFPPKKDEKKDEKDESMDDEEKKAAAEMAEADLLGRQMAHAFVNELDVIQKTAAAQAQQVDHLLVDLATQRANEFLAEKVAAGQLCGCLNPQCDGSCTKTAAAQQPRQQVIDQAAVQLLAANGFGHLLQ